MNTKHGLGRGLGALLSSSPAPAPAADTAASMAQELPIDSIVANPRQPRKTFDDKSLRDLAESLKRSAEASNRRKASPFQSAMSVLNFYINRAGHSLTEAQKSHLEQAKTELRRLFGKE